MFAGFLNSSAVKTRCRDFVNVGAKLISSEVNGFPTLMCIGPLPPVAFMSLLKHLGTFECSIHVDK